MIRLLIPLLFAALLIPETGNRDTDIYEFDNRRHVTLYNTYAYQDGDEWVVPARVWVHKQRRWLQGITNWMVRIMGEYTPGEMEIFRERLTDILADSKWRRTVTITFPEDPEEAEFRIVDAAGEEPRTDRNGMIIGNIRIPAEDAERITGGLNGEDVSVMAKARSNRYRGHGKIRFMQPEGVSVISDIDDTVKVTEIPAGSRTVVFNTFFKPYKASPRMAEMYHQWEDASFHYVSGSPWQLYRLLAGFLLSEEAGFPEGSFHMKSARKNVLTISSWRDMIEFITNENLTFEQKLSQIAYIMERFPDRQFILVGDSGERDPEIYRTLSERYSDQVKEVIIRDVINDRVNRPERLEGMTIFPAPTVLRIR